MSFDQADTSEFGLSAAPKLAESFVEVITQLRGCYGRALELISEMGAAGVSDLAGYPSLREFLVHAARLHPRTAGQLIRHAEALTESTTLTGQLVAASLSATGDAVREGVLDSDHVELIAKTMRAVPAWVSEPDRDTAEATLVDAACSMDAKTLSGVAERLLATLDQNGPEPTDPELAQPVNELRYIRQRSGRTLGKFSLAPEAGALLDTLISTLAAPRPADEEGPDPRGVAERQGDALAELLEHAADSGAIPSQRRERPHLSVHIGLDALRDGLGHALLDGAGLVTAREARLLACDCKVIPTVLGANGEPLDVGRVSYTVPAHLRRALTVRDLGCAFPGCRRRPHQCHAHHVVHWANGGVTAIDNCVLLCARHHRMIHHSEWRVEIIDGQPVFTPPAWVDRQRRRRANTVHIRPG